MDVYQSYVYISTFTSGILLLYSPNKDIQETCPNSNIWYLVLMHGVTSEFTGVLIPLNIHALLDECNRKNLGKTALYTYLLIPCMITCVLLIICIVGVIYDICRFGLRCLRQKKYERIIDTQEQDVVA